MKNGFEIELYGEIFKNCFIECSSYKNGNLQLSLYGLDNQTNQIAHLADITLNQDKIYLTDDTIIVDNKFNPTLVPQLKQLGIITDKIRMCIINNVFYPIYKLDFSKINSRKYYMQNLVAA